MAVAAEQVAGRVQGAELAAEAAHVGAHLFRTVLLRRVIRGEWMLILAGGLSILFGILLVVNPVAGLVALVWIIGAYALISGALLVALALRLRSLGAQMVIA